MLIGIDMMGVQSPGSRGRGIGRLSSSVVAHLLGLDPAVDFRLYAHDGLPADDFPAAPNAEVVPLRRDPARGEARLAHTMERLARENPDRLDALLILSPFELHDGYSPPARPLHGPALGAILYDLIPFRYPERYLEAAPHATDFYRRLESLRLYDTLCAISDSTRDDFRALLDLPPGRVVTIGAACDAGRFAPDRTAPLPAATRRGLHELGITGPFVYSVANLDYHKNVRGLVDAFALLPAALRRAHQLVLTCTRFNEDSAELLRHAERLGLGDRVVLTGAIGDDFLRVLYQRCAAFVLPSLYEGFGLPLLEAMHCGAAVVGGNNTSQVEVVGDAGLLANAADASDLAAKLGAILADPRVGADLGLRARARAATFSWRSTAERTLEALTGAVRRRRPRRIRADGPHDPAPRPRIAVFAPFAPKRSGVATYTGRLIEHLKPTYAIDLYHDAGYIPEPALAGADFGAFDHRLFERNAAVLGYRGILYQMGNSWYHRFIYEAMRRHPGITTQHDFCLTGFQWWYSHELDGTCEHFEAEVRHHHPVRADRYLALLPDWMREPGGVQVAYAKRGLILNRRVFESSRRVIVHSPWCVDQARRLYPEYAGKVVLIPHGIKVATRTPAERTAIRARFGLPQDALIVASFGILTKDKMNNEAIAAFAAVADEVPGAIFVLVGRDLEGGEARRKAAELGVQDRVHFLGHQPDDAFTDLVAAADLGLSLRRPPTYGETSGALLDLLRTGIPTIVTDVGTFSDYPADVVRKVRWQADGQAGLTAAVRELAGDPQARAALSRTALAYVRETHTWEQAAAAYVAAIESTFAERPARRRPASPGGVGPGESLRERGSR